MKYYYNYKCSITIFSKLVLYLYRQITVKATKSFVQRTDLPDRAHQTILEHVLSVLEQKAACRVTPLVTSSHDVSNKTYQSLNSSAFRKVFCNIYNIIAMTNVNKFELSANIYALAFCCNCFVCIYSKMHYIYINI